MLGALSLDRPVRARFCAISASVHDEAAELLAVARHRDRAAFERICRAYAGRLRGFLRKRLPSGEADEVAQEVLFRVWARADRYDPARASVSTWIFTIARNCAVDRLRKQRHFTVDDRDPAYVADDEGGAARSATRRVDRSLVVEALDGLPTEQAAALRAVYLEEKSMPEVADAHGIPLGTVKSRVRLAVNAIRRRLGGAA